MRSSIGKGATDHEQEVGHEEDCHLRGSIPQDLDDAGWVVDNGLNLIQQAAGNEGCKEHSQHL